MKSSTSTNLRIASAAYPIERLADLDAWREKQAHWLSKAASQGAQIAVFPEYAGLEIIGTFPDDLAHDLTNSIRALSDLVPEIDSTLTALSQQHDIMVLAGSLPILQPDSSYRNVARWFTPSHEGVTAKIEKIMMTRFERETWGIAGGDSLKVLETPIGSIGVLICYDCEFPQVARQMCAHGAEVLLIPSCTDTLSGAARVRISARARALESQCYTVVAPTVGRAPWSPATDVNLGRTGFYGPPDQRMPTDGRIAEGEIDQPGWLVCDLDLNIIRKIRNDGEVLNFKDWSESDRALPVLQVPVEGAD